MKKIWFWLFLFWGYNDKLFSMSSRRKLHLHLSPNSGVLEKSLVDQMPDDMVETRQASREFIKLEEDIFFTHQKDQIVTDDFETLCERTQKYKNKYLKILQKNGLLRDGDCELVYNPFNKRLLGALVAMANVYKFNRESIPSPIEENKNEKILFDFAVEFELIESLPGTPNSGSVEFAYDSLHSPSLNSPILHPGNTTPSSETEQILGK